MIVLMSSDEVRGREKTQLRGDPSSHMARLSLPAELILEYRTEVGAWTAGPIIRPPPAYFL
jgi:hypothetical protein